MALQPAKLLLPFVPPASASGAELAYSEWILKPNGYVSLAAPGASPSITKVAEFQSEDCQESAPLSTCSQPDMFMHTARKVAASPSLQSMLKFEQMPRSFSRTYARTCPLHMMLVLQNCHTSQASGKTKDQTREQKQNSRSCKC